MRSLLSAILGLSLVSIRMADDAPSASPEDAYAPADTAPTSDTTADIAAAAPVEAGEPVAAASSAADTPASDIASSAPTASTEADTVATTDPVPAVALDVEDHAEARERFAGLMAKLHAFEHEAVDELKADLHAIGLLLHLHSVASTQADATGDYKPENLS
ncbi:hypothetical protein [Ralstonia pickettii]|uniref:hypothetical protein n=1 Tax=Ralstonia pickettii TaxID=329 RepID=UPI0015FD792B|nr:hypothetical protein [Ralstonia pickettii]MBB0026814.1 hypothetical protein [Ralstonia pickettii]MBB0034688.1 hypothetical protein [Ralstonia pickettii]MBB0099977.1 hypothetical protein [Ralstonia pickettii]MBB0109936.1 hypothetical protein [Ralstonia pickettii]MBB0130916.1 hypothetical protein [Ralstonia pickettii]